MHFAARKKRDDPLPSSITFFLNAVSSFFFSISFYDDTDGRLAGSSDRLTGRTGSYKTGHFFRLEDYISHQAKANDELRMAVCRGGWARR